MREINWHHPYGVEQSAAALRIPAGRSFGEPAESLLATAPILTAR